MTHGIVCAAQPEAAEAGALVLKAGGNAVDAAIACAITQGVVDPLMTGIGGVGSALVHDAKTGRTENINFLGVAPAAAREDMWEDAIEGEPVPRVRVDEEEGWEGTLSPKEIRRENNHKRRTTDKNDNQNQTQKHS